LQSGDRLHAKADGPGRVLLERIKPPPEQVPVANAPVTQRRAARLSAR
jgi:hypothetical protein